MLETEVLEPTLGVEETSITTETPAAPEGVAPSAPGDEPAITESAASLSTRQRGPDGRFIKADGTQASEAEHAAIEAAAPASPPLAATPPQPASAPGEAFVFRADGQKIPVPGAALSSDGTLTIPADQVPAIRQLLAEGISHRGSWRQREQEYKQQIESASATERARSDKYNRASVLLWERVTDPNWLAAAVADPREVEYLRRELDLELKTADLKAPAPRATPRSDPAEQQQQLEQSARSVLDEEVELLLDGPHARALYTSAEDRKALLARYQRRLNAYFTEHEGEIVLDRQVLREDFEEELKLRQGAAKTASANAKAKEFNDRRNAPAVAAPPVVSPKGPGSSGGTAGRVFKTREEYNKAMGLN
jgi:hypothetical protein